MVASSVKSRIPKTSDDLDSLRIAFTLSVAADDAPGCGDRTLVSVRNRPSSPPDGA
jgi:hypothetical protein